MFSKKIPHTYVIVFFVILVASILTWIIPGGEYIQQNYTENGVEKTRMVFQETQKNPQSWQVFSAIFNGFVKQLSTIDLIMNEGYEASKILKNASLVHQEKIS